MAKYNVTHSCGHESTVNLLGKMVDRDRKTAWLASRPCRECATADARAAGPTVRVGRAAEIMDAASDALAMGWTVLTAAGSAVTADGLAAMRAKLAPAAA